MICFIKNKLYDWGVKTFEVPYLCMQHTVHNYLLGIL